MSKMQQEWDDAVRKAAGSEMFMQRIVEALEKIARDGIHIWHHQVPEPLQQYKQFFHVPPNGPVGGKT